ncbi:hypothetical protein PIIN_10983 [Serendipita indica DSM 11827]|uniref:Uncharacterized protein n=1 Tax=Serendipita indica (strain DSM 11827) TaxID=1109443 RepID=G4U0A5_SERID|nr:hypothetical protein PIIN_10983 [Serendipita indica DSM 11827]
MKIEPGLALQEDSKAHSELSGIPSRNELYFRASNGFRSHPELSAAPLNALSFASLADPALIVCLQVCSDTSPQLSGGGPGGGAYRGMLEDVEETNADADVDADADAGSLK